MGTNLRGLLVKKEVSIEDLVGKILVVDTYNILYQFLSSIRQRDGSLLLDSKGNVTSHLTGLFNRSTKLLSKGIKLAFVFDGTPPKLKTEERDRRKSIKIEAEKKYEQAKADEDFEAMRKYGSRTSRLTKVMIDEAKILVRALGCPVIQAPSEGEAQAAIIVNNGDAYAVASQDYDSLLYGSKRTLKNLTISGKKKQRGKLSYETIQPEILELEENLKHLEFNRDQLIAMAMLIGTDFNVGGIKGIGPKKGYKLVKEHKMDFEVLFKQVEWDNFFDIAWEEVFNLIKNMPVDEKYVLEWGEVNKKAIIDLLVEKHDFSKERVEMKIQNLIKEQKKRKQTGLGEWI